MSDWHHCPMCAEPVTIRAANAPGCAEYVVAWVIGFLIGVFVVLRWLS